jgi:hypothetical protein
MPRKREKTAAGGMQVCKMRWREQRFEPKQLSLFHQRRGGVDFPQRWTKAPKEKMQRSPKKVNFERRGGGWLDLQTDAAKLHQKVSPWRKGGGWGVRF